jgi:N-acetylmuramoyl-L-alanine amidase
VLTGHRPPLPARRECLALALAAAVAGLLTSACGGGAAASSSARPGTAASPAVSSAASATGTGPAARPSGPGPGGAVQPGAGSLGPGARGADAGGTGAGSTRPGSGPGIGAGTEQPAAAGPAGSRPLAGRVVGIDPGHNGGNGSDPGYISQLIWNGREQESCDTTGTQTDGGYTEATFNFNVATDLRAYLQRDGARVVLTRTGNRGDGPCVNRRAQLINQARASVAVDIHADGGPSWGRGFTVLEPVADGPNDNVIGSSLRFGGDVRSALLAGTAMPESDYYGRDGLIRRDDLAGLNLTSVPKILIECGNMRNATDARLLTSASFQHQIARALLAAIVSFLR